MMMQAKQRDAHKQQDKQTTRRKLQPTVFMEGSSIVSEPVQQKKKQDSKSVVEQGSASLTNHRVKAGEALVPSEPGRYFTLGMECFYFAGHNISIQESMDTYGALIWPGAMALCQFLENNQHQVNLVDKEVLEIGAGTGLLSVVASLLGARVTATDLPDILPNLTFNLLRNTNGRSRHTPQVAALAWGRNLELHSPSTRYDYVLAADVVYPHDCVDDLLKTFHYFYRPGSGTTLLWANKVRFESDLKFAECFQSSFDATLLAELPQQEVRIYQATAKE